MKKFFLPYQIRWLEDQSPLKIIEKSRQVGMTFTDAYDSVKKAATKQARLDVWISSRDEAQARLYVEDCARWATVVNQRAVALGKHVVHEKSKTSAYVLEFKTGRRIYSLSSNPNALAGKRGHVKLDEFALHQDQRLLYRVAKPVTQWGGQLCLISTHRGSTTLFNQLIRQIKEGGNPMGWSLHTVPLEKAIAEGLVEKINGKSAEARASSGSETREEFLSRIRRECVDEVQWLQEYCCIPSEEANAFISYEMITACEAVEVKLLSFDELVEYCASGALPKKTEEEKDAEAERDGHKTANHNPQLFLGVDVARKHDLCVIDVGEKIGDVVWDRARIELQGASFSEVEAELYRVLKLRALKRACIDATGLGAQLAERARQKFGWKVEPITFTAPIKEELAFGLRGDFEDKRIRIVRDDKLASDLRGIRKQVTSSGNMRFEGESADSHCDRFWAKALRQHAARYNPQVRAVVG